MDQMDYFEEQDGRLVSRPMTPDYSGIKGATGIDSLFVGRVFMGLYNAMCIITNGGAIDEFNDKFERYYPDEVGCNETQDNAYFTLGCRLSKEIADKLSPVYGRLPSGRCVYLDPEEPITIAGDFTKFWCHGYVK